jgi:hypothetical protein
VHQTQPEKQTTKTNTIQTTHMKIKTSILTLLAAALSAGSSWGQLPISPTSGITRISLTANVTNAVAVPFAKSIPFEGTISAVSGTTLTLAGVTLTPGALTNHAIYIPTHLDPGTVGGAYGRIVNIVSNTGTQVVTDAAIVPFVGDDFQIIEQHTLSSLLGQLTTLQLLGGTSPSNADNVSIEVGGVFTTYFHRTGTGWQLASDFPTAGPDRGGVSVPFGKGILVRRRGGNRTLTVSGEAITGRFRPTTVASAANNMVNNPFLVPVPLIESGVSAFITSGTSRNNSDTIFIEAAGVFSGYWRRTSNGNFYPISDTSGTGPAVDATVLLNPGKAILFVDRGTAGFGMPQPFNE